MLVEDTDYGDSRRVPVPTLLAKPLTISLPSSAAQDPSSSFNAAASSQSDAPPSGAFCFPAPPDKDTRGARPPRPKFLNVDDFFVIKASTECKYWV